MQTNDKTDRYFRDRLAGYEQNPPDANWDMIAQKMSKKRKKAMGMLFFKIAAGMALIVSLGVGYYFVNQSERTQGIPEIAASEQQIPGNTSLEKPALPAPSDTQNQNSPLPLHSTESGSELPDKNSNPDIVLQLENVAMQFNTLEMPTLVDRTAPFADPQPEMPQMNAIVTPGVLQSLPGIGNTESNKESLTQEEAIALIMAEYNAPLAEIAEKKEKQRWELGGEIAPLYSDRSISSNSLESSVISNLNQNESGIMAYAGGIRIAFSPAKRISVQSGVYYSRYGQKKNEVMMYNNIANTFASEDAKLITNSTGIISVNKQDGNRSINESDGVIAHTFYNSTPTEEVTIKQTFDYFEIPVLIKYKFIDQKMDFSFSGGIITNFLVGNKVNLIENGERSEIGETTQINEINYVGSVGLGIEYPLIPRFSLTLEPRFRYYINTIDQSSQISVHPFSFGFFAGVNYRF